MISETRAMTMAPEADAGVVWYGYPPLEYVDASAIKAPLMAHYATDDAAFPIAAVDTLVTAGDSPHAAEHAAELAATGLSIVRADRLER